MTDKPIAFDAYEALAESYAARIDTKPHNAYYERPATLSLLPPVEGKRVLDAGCGPGVYTDWLVRHGAQVIAVDAVEKMVRLARERAGAGADIRQANLDEPLPFIADDSLDMVLSALALDYVKDWPAVFSEFHRMLRAGGHLVFSVGHPFADFLLHPEGNYFEMEVMVDVWKGFDVQVPMPTYRRPLGTLVNSLLDAGFILERIIEPTPVEEFKHADPKHYAELSRQPGFLCVRASKKA